MTASLNNLGDAGGVLMKTEPVETLLSQVRGARENGNGWTAFCPGHDDRHERSLSIGVGEGGRVLVNCFAGCTTEHIVDALGLTMADLFIREPNGRHSGSNGQTGGRGDPPPNASASVHQSDAGLTLAQYARAKQLDLEHLRSWGLSDAPYYSPHAVKIAYRDEAGEEVATRFRLRLGKSTDGDERFKWKSGAKICLYGRERLPLARERGYVVIVEGESDCHTLWHHDEPAIGIPGANNWKEDRDASLLADIPLIYVVIESDNGGEAVLNWLRTSVIRDRVRLVNLDPFKDPSALHNDDPAHFAERWESAKAAAIPLSAQLDAEAHAEEAATWEECQELACHPDILTHAGVTVASLGVAGEEAAIKLVFLATISRLLPRPVSLVVKGPSSAGKSYLVEQTLRLFPSEAFYALTAMSERALAYSEEPLQHRMLVIYEAAGLASEMASYLMRSLLSEGRLRYETVIKGPDGMHAKLIEREGPTGLIVTTTATRLHPENETRMASITLSDTPEQTRAILRARASHHREEPNLGAWHALQRWLALGERRVNIPFAAGLADLISNSAVRVRRDFNFLLTLIETHALLHRASRERDSEGCIVATWDDYQAVRVLVEPLVAAGIEATVPPSIRETVESVQRLCPNQDDTTSVATIARELRLDKSAASRRALAAKERGYLVNLETRSRQPAKYGLGDPLPEDAPVLPSVTALRDWCTDALEREGGDPSPQYPQNGFSSVGAAASFDTQHNLMPLADELDSTEVVPACDGDNHHFETRFSVSTNPHGERIITNKPVPLAALTSLDTVIVADEATRRSPEHVARCLAGITARIEAGDNLPGDWLSLRFWEAIRDEQKRQSLLYGTTASTETTESLVP